MSITHVILECFDEENKDWLQVVDRWSWIGFRPDWKHNVERCEPDVHSEDGDFMRYYYNIKIENKKDLLNVAQLIHELGMAYSEIKIEWITKTTDASLSFRVSKDGDLKISGGPIMSQINDKAAVILKTIKDLVKNY